MRPDRMPRVFASGLVAVMLAVWLVVGIACGGIGARSAPANEPVRYPVPAEVGSIVVDETAFAAFATAVRPDLERESTSKDPDIAKARLFVLAMLDALDENWASSLAYLDKARDLETKPEDKAMTGLTLRVWIDVAGDVTRYRAAFESRVTRLPHDKLIEPLGTLRAMAQVFTPDVCRQLVNQEVSPHVKNNSVDLGQAHAIVFQRYAVVRIVPVGKDIDDVLGALALPQ